MKKLLSEKVATFTRPATSAAAFDILRVTQEGNGSVNLWILEGGDCVVLIDAQRSLSLGRNAAERVRATGKPLLAVSLTHPHTRCCR